MYTNAYSLPPGVDDSGSGASTALPPGGDGNGSSNTATTRKRDLPEESEAPAAKKVNTNRTYEVTLLVPIDSIGLILGKVKGKQWW